MDAPLRVVLRNLSFSNQGLQRNSEEEAAEPKLDISSIVKHWKTDDRGYDSRVVCFLVVVGISAIRLTSNFHVAHFILISNLILMLSNKITKIPITTGY